MLLCTHEKRGDGKTPAGGDHSHGFESRKRQVRSRLEHAVFANHGVEQADRRARGTERIPAASQARTVTQRTTADQAPAVPALYVFFSRIDCSIPTRLPSTQNSTRNAVIPARGGEKKNGTACSPLDRGGPSRRDAPSRIEDRLSRVRPGHPVIPADSPVPLRQCCR